MLTGAPGSSNTVAVQVTCTANTGTILAVDVSLPANSLGTTKLPLLGGSLDRVIVTEGGVALWSGGRFRPGVEGVSGAAAQGGVLAIWHGSGQYSFQLRT